MVYLQKKENIMVTMTLSQIIMACVIHILNTWRLVGQNPEDVEKKQ